MVNSLNKIIYYYQNFNSLQPLIDCKLQNVYLYISSIHFGLDKDNVPYLHINDTTPDNQGNLWSEIENAARNNIKIMIMIGGAGGAYTTFFQYFEPCYRLLQNLIQDHPVISGIDLDIEETVSLDNVKMLINRLNNDFVNTFIITMAPVAYSLMTNNPGMCGFSYHDLYTSDEGTRINWFNVQCYYSYTCNVYNTIVNNGYPADKVVFGMLGDNFNVNTFPEALDEIKKVYSTYSDMGGTVLWEYGDTTIDPIIWGIQINELFKKDTNYCLLQ